MGSDEFKAKRDEFKTRVDQFEATREEFKVKGYSLEKELAALREALAVRPRSLVATR